MTPHHPHHCNHQGPWEIKRLQQELRRKDKALAVALLYPQAAAKPYASRKIQAYLGEDEED